MGRTTFYMLEQEQKRREAEEKAKQSKNQSKTTKKATSQKEDNDGKTGAKQKKGNK